MGKSTWNEKRVWCHFMQYAFRVSLKIWNTFIVWKIFKTSLKRLEIQFPLPCCIDIFQKNGRNFLTKSEKQTKCGNDSNIPNVNFIYIHVSYFYSSLKTCLTYWIAIKMVKLISVTLRAVSTYWNGKQFSFLFERAIT